MAIYLGDKKIAGVGNTRLNIGEIVPSMLPLFDAGLHLLDGALISGSGTYAAFVTYIAGLVSSYPNLFVTEANWQSSVSAYGVCGKFVYDSTNNTVRLPKVTGIIEGTTDVTALGDLVEAGLPNITGSIGYTRANGYGNTGAFYTANGLTDTHIETTGGSTYGTGIDASLSSSIYKNSFNKVQPQTIKTLYYICIATSAKTSIQANIDQIATDLNLKAGTDLTNLTESGNLLGASLSMPSNTASVKNLTLGADGTIYTADSTGYVFIKGVSKSAYAWCYVNTKGLGTVSQAPVANCTIANWCPVQKGNPFSITYGGVDINDFYFVYAKGSESEDS